MNPPLGQTSRYSSGPRRATLRLTFLLYLATVSIDAVRKVGGLPTSLVGVIYLIVGGMFLVLLPGIRNKSGNAPASLPVWLVVLTLWCAIEALVPRIPMSTALLGTASYVFFVPLFYVGAELMATDYGAIKTLRWVTVIGALLGLGAVLSAVLGPSAPPILQPIVPSVGIHSSSAGNIYLAPSVFATGEQAAEQLLIAIFAWAALASLPGGRLGRVPSAIFATLISAGLLAAERRADIVATILGLGSLMILGRLRSQDDSSRAIQTMAPRKRSGTASALALAVICSTALLLFMGTNRVIPFLTSTSSGLDAVILIFSPVQSHLLIGQGTGTSTQGIGVLGANNFMIFVGNHIYSGYVQGGRSFIAAEGSIARTWLELGVVGVAIYSGLFVSVLGPAIISLRHLDGVCRALTVLTIALGIVFLKGQASLNDPLVQPLFWLAAGGIWGRSRALGASVPPLAGALAVDSAAEPCRYGPVSPSLR